MPASAIPGASVWEQSVYDHITRHIDSEREILQAYDRLANETSSPAFAYLAKIILDDERRHHQMLRDLAETIRVTAELSGEPTPTPDLGMFKADRERILETTERFLAVENGDNKDLERLAGELRDTRNTTLWQLVVRLIQHDNEKHRRTLQFIRDRARECL
jgi:rubrerythrin